MQFLQNVWYDLGVRGSPVLFVWHSISFEYTAYAPLFVMRSGEL
ncbi:protein of unknown function [Cupriavidus taiwanensis]|nr:protein of unknown function [Cupriavidus taiwanensis]